jgi:hypothetical protein
MSASPVSRPKFDLGEEFRIIPIIAVVLAGAAFLCMQWVWHVFMLTHEHNPPPAPFRAIMGFFTGVLVAMFILLVGYVNADSKRRGMNRTLWTLLVMFIPNAIGFVLYFFVRQPLTSPCPRCGNPIQSGFRFCPACQFQLVPTCPSCGTALQPGFNWCPGCGKQVGTTPPSPATQA